MSSCDGDGQDPGVLGVTLLLDMETTLHVHPRLQLLQPQPHSPRLLRPEEVWHVWYICMPGMSGMTGMSGMSGMCGMCGMSGMSGMSGTSGITILEIK